MKSALSLTWRSHACGKAILSFVRHWRAKCARQKSHVMNVTSARAPGAAHTLLAKQHTLHVECRALRDELAAARKERDEQRDAAIAERDALICIHVGTSGSVDMMQRAVKRKLLLHCVYLG